MKTKSVGPILSIAIVAGLTASFALPAKDAEAKVRMQAAPQNQLVDRNEAAIKARARLAAPCQPAGPSNGSTMSAPVSVADGSVRVLKTFQATDPHKVSRLTVLAGLPDWIWCMLHFCKRSL
jgi:hypothetical protein